MKKIIASFLLLISIINVGWANPKVFTLQKGDKTVSIFGTIHVTKPTWLPLSTAVTTALKQADALAVELDMTDSKTLSETMQYMMMHGVSKKNLATILSADEQAKMKTFLGPLATGMMQMRPWIVAVTVSLQRAQAMGFSDKSVDEWLIKQAKAQQKPVIALETSAEQFHVFEQLSEAEEIEFLRSSLADEQQFYKEISQTVAVWQHNDQAAAQTLLSEFKGKTPRLHQAMFTDRNQAMVERIIKLNQQYPTLMMAVGALHLYGDGGVIQRLKRQGYHLMP